MCVCTRIDIDFFHQYFLALSLLIYEVVTRVIICRSKTCQIWVENLGLLSSRGRKLDILLFFVSFSIDLRLVAKFSYNPSNAFNPQGTQTGTRVGVNNHVYDGRREHKNRSL